MAKKIIGWVMLSIAFLGIAIPVGVVLFLILWEMGDIFLICLLIAIILATLLAIGLNLIDE